MNTPNKLGLLVSLSISKRETYFEIRICLHFNYMYMCVTVWVRSEEGMESHGVRSSVELTDLGAGKLTWVLCKSCMHSCRVIFGFVFLTAYVRKIDNFACLFLIQFNTNEGPIKIVERQYQYIEINTMDFKINIAIKLRKFLRKLELLRSTQQFHLWFHLQSACPSSASALFKYSNYRRIRSQSPNSTGARATAQLFPNGFIII